MSIHATLLVGWSGTLAFLAVWFALLSRLRPDERLFRRFAQYSTANAIGMLSTAALVSASSAPAAAAARSAQLATFGAATVLLPTLVEALTGARVRKLLPAVVGICVWVLAAGGTMVDPASSDGRASLTPLGSFAGLVVAISVLPAIAQLAWSAFTQRGLGFIAGALVVALAGGLVDLARLVSGQAPFELASHSLGIATLAIGATLMRRIVAAEEEVERAAAELEASMQALHAAERALVETRSRAAIGELAAVIAHEVRNPLAVLRNAAASLRKPTTTAVDIETLVAIVREETRRLEELGRSLAHFAEPMPYRPGRVALEPLLRDVVSAVQRAHEGEPGIDVVVAPTSAAVHADAALLRQALVNVVDNAFRAMPGGGRVEISAHDGGGSVRIEVADEGEGMTDEVLARARDPFFTTRATGTGLGLALVDKVVRLHGGELALARREPRGTSVAITIGAAR